MIDVQPRVSAVEAALTVRLQVVSANSGRPLLGRSVRLWPCEPAAVEVRISDESGWAEFDLLLPSPSAGHWPHVHFEIHGRRGRLALPADAYAVGALSPADLAAAFAADEPPIMAALTGDAQRGLVATRTLPIFTPGRG